MRHRRHPVQVVVLVSVFAAAATAGQLVRAEFPEHGLATKDYESKYQCDKVSKSEMLYLRLKRLILHNQVYDTAARQWVDLGEQCDFGGNTGTHFLVSSVSSFDPEHCFSISESGDRPGIFNAGLESEKDCQVYCDAAHSDYAGYVWMPDTSLGLAGNTVSGTRCLCVSTDCSSGSRATCYSGSSCALVSRMDEPLNFTYVDGVFVTTAGGAFYQGREHEGQPLDFETNQIMWAADPTGSDSGNSSFFIAWSAARTAMTTSAGMLQSCSGASTAASGGVPRTCRQAMYAIANSPCFPNVFERLTAHQGVAMCETGVSSCEFFAGRCELVSDVPLGAPTGLTLYIVLTLVAMCVGAGINIRIDRQYR